MKILARYLAKETLVSSLFVFTALMTLYAFFDLLNELGSLGQGGYGLINILAFVALSIPGHVYELLPVAALIGTLFALARMVANSEFTIMLVSGISIQRVAGYLMGVGLLFTALTFVFGELIAPVSERYAQQVKLTATHALVAQAFRSGLPLRQSAAGDRQTARQSTSSPELKAGKTAWTTGQFHNVLLFVCSCADAGYMTTDWMRTFFPAPPAVHS